jgi:hypothetical protein
LTKIKDRTILILCFTGIFLFIGAIYVTDHVNTTSYHNVLDPARVAILDDLEMNGVEVIQGRPELGGMPPCPQTTTTYSSADVDGKTSAQSTTHKAQNYSPEPPSTS